MKKSLLICALAMVLILLLAGCGCSHEWYAATCSAPKTCSLCGETEGEALPHTWEDATCTEAKTCKVCDVTKGEPLGHDWKDATCTEAKVCKVCEETEGEALGHTWQDATCTAPKTCSVCQLTEGDPTEHQWQEATTEAPETCILCGKTTGSKLETDPRFTTKSTKDLHGTWICDVMLTDEMMGLVNFGGVECQMKLTFGKTGEMTMTLDAKDTNLLMQKMKTYTINTLYETFTGQGLSKADVDKMMLDTYGMSVVDYVDAALKNYDFEALFDFAKAEEVYYVENNMLYTAMDWKAIFESSAFTLNGNQLVIEGLALEEGGQDLVWNRA